MGDSPISPKDFGASFKTFMEQMSRESPADEPFFRRRLREHFGADPSKFSIVAEKFAHWRFPREAGVASARRRESTDSGLERQRPAEMPSPSTCTR